MSVLVKFSSFCPLLLLSCFPDQHLHVLLAEIQLINVWSCYSIRSWFFHAGEWSTTLCWQSILCVLPACLKLLQSLFWLRLMTWLSFPVLCAFITIPTKRGPRNHPLIFFFHFQRIIPFAFPLPIYKCPWPQPICIRPIFLPLPCMKLINPSDSFSEFCFCPSLSPEEESPSH